MYSLGCRHNETKNKPRMVGSNRYADVTALIINYRRLRIKYRRFSSMKNKANQNKAS